MRLQLDILKCFFLGGGPNNFLGHSYHIGIICDLRYQCILRSYVQEAHGI